MLLENTIFYRKEWIWSTFLKYLISKLNNYEYSKHLISPKYVYKESTFGSKKNKSKVNLYTWCIYNNKINIARAVCINSINYSVLNFLIIPNRIYNMPFFGVDFVSLPNSHLLVLDLQPSTSVKDQFSKELLDQIIDLRKTCHQKLPIAQKMSGEVSKFFSPGLIWSKLPKDNVSDELIKHQLYDSFKNYLNLYLKILYECEEVKEDKQLEIKNGQNKYLQYRKINDPARPMLNSLFGRSYTEELINDVLFKAR